MPAAAPSRAACSGCGKKGVVFACTACKLARYCSPDCQRRAWPGHKPYCQAPDRTALWRAALQTLRPPAILQAFRSLGPNFTDPTTGYTLLHDFAFQTGHLLRAQLVGPAFVYELLGDILDLGPALNTQVATCPARWGRWRARARARPKAGWVGVGGSARASEGRLGGGWGERARVRRPIG